MLIRCLTFKSHKLVAAILLLLLYSCSEPEPVKPVEPEEPPPPLPSNGCAPHIVNGYCNKSSYFPLETVQVYLHGNTVIELCALNIYSVTGELVHSVGTPLSTQQTPPSNSSSSGFGYTVTASFQVPDDLPSGLYTIENAIPFIIKSKEEADLLVVYPSNTANAYATSGGKSLYSSDRPSAVSFLRPIPLQDFCLSCLKWFPSLSQFTKAYIADVDLDDYQNFENRKVIVLIGHNEYWTRAARENFDRFVNEGNDALILSGNTMWWQVRYADEEKTQMICYKDFAADPVSDPLLKTHLWNNPALGYPIISSIGADFDKGGYGLKSDNGWNGYKVTLSSSPLLDGTSLKNGDILSCPTVEYDGAPLLWGSDGRPALDLHAMNVIKGELIAYDLGFRVRETAGTFFVSLRREGSGIIVNTGSTNWCSNAGIGGSSGEDLKTITLNALNLLVKNEAVFSN